MHTIMAVVVLVLVYKLADWQKIKAYHPTLLYIGSVNLLYLFLTAGYPMWRYVPDEFSNHTVTEVVNSFIILPAVALLFLSFYPDNKKKRVLYFVYWVVGSTIWEIIFLSFNKLSFSNGWSFGIEPLFYIVMYSMIRLHYTRPHHAYLASIIFILCLLWIYQVPIGTTYDLRG